MSDLERFKKAQEADYDLALKEIRQGKKESHWIWYIFPQLKGLGLSEQSNYYGIASIQEARDYLDDEMLHHRLIEISEALLNLETKNIEEILPDVDVKKVLSSMTLFAQVADNPVFMKVIDRYYKGKMDEKTLALLKKEG